MWPHSVSSSHLDPIRFLFRSSICVHLARLTIAYDISNFFVYHLSLSISYSTFAVKRRKADYNHTNLLGNSYSLGSRGIK